MIRAVRISMPETRIYDLLLMIDIKDGKGRGICYGVPMWGLAAAFL